MTNKTGEVGRKCRPFSIAFDAKASARTKDSNGYMRVSDCNITKEQVVPYYGHEIPDYEELGLDGQKIYKMYRPGKEIAKAAKTFDGVPLALKHHEMTAEYLPKQHIVGSIGTNAEYKAPYLVASLIVTDQTAIDAIENGEYKELSAAYQYTPVMKGGYFNGQHYDGIMTAIEGNHVALVKEGRAGPDVVVKDAKPVHIQTAATNAEKERSKTAMSIVRTLKRLMAYDAVPAIENLEVNLAQFMQAVQVVEAQREGLSPSDIGIDIEDGADVNAIVGKFFPKASDDKKKAIAEQLTELKEAPESEGGEKEINPFAEKGAKAPAPEEGEEGEPEEGAPEGEEPEDDEEDTKDEDEFAEEESEEEVEPTPEGEEPEDDPLGIEEKSEEETEDEEEFSEEETEETDPIERENFGEPDEEDEEQAKDEEEIEKEEAFKNPDEKGEEDFREVMDSCGFDSNDPKQVELFKAGVEHGRKCNGECDKGNLNNFLDKHKDAIDADIDKAKEEIEDKIKRHYKDLNQAANDCRTVIGALLDPFAFDSANDIYKKALLAMHVDLSGVPKSTYRALYRAVSSNKSTGGLPAVAMDSKGEPYIQGARGIKDTVDRLNAILVQ